MRLFFKKCCRKKIPEMKPGAILDQVISQSSSSANKCLLYKLADFKRGGDLIDAINTGGLIAVEQLIRDQFGVFMYNNGKGQMINRAEFLRWKYRDHTEVVIPIEASLSIHDPLGKWTDHKACWQMQYRGSLGESLLHVLIICDSKVHTKLARVLLRVFPVLALDVMEGEEYLGASALHLAIAYSNNELVADLIEAGADINQRAIGSFFLPRDQQRSNPAKNTDYEGLAYLGEYPLAWSACCANESVYNLLMDNGADPDLPDTFGNMILHMVVVCDKLDMFGYALRHPKTPARNGIANLSGLTPLTLACKLGRAEVFREMLELSAREFWRYSNITCSGYPLNALDTLLPDGRTNWNSALFIILNGTKEEHLDMLDGGIIQKLLEEKWKTFARNQFLKRLLILFIHLFSLSISVYLRPSREEEERDGDGDVENEENSKDEGILDIEKSRDIKTIVRYCCELATIAGVLSYVIFQQGDEVKNQGLSAFLKQLSHAPAKAIFLVSNLLILACIPFRMVGDTLTEEAILVYAVPGSWFLLMFFAGAVRLTGPFVTMIYSMLTGDMFTFGIIYSIVLFGFSQAFYFLYKGHPQVQTTMFNTFPSTWMALFQTTLGDYNYPDLNQTSYPNLAKTVFVIFMIFVPILLLNMLIAMMGNTYAHVIEQSEKEWVKQWAKIVVTLERAVPQADAQKYLEAYSIPLGPADDSGYETRGVMIIKSKSKTRAKQRKGAVSNWKRVGRVTLSALKKRGMTGEEMRRLMWGRASITSPVKITKQKLKDPYGLGLDIENPLGNALDMMSFGQDGLMSVGVTGGNEGGTKPHQTNIHISDPFRDLVLVSEAKGPKDAGYMNNLKKLAKQALILVEQSLLTTSATAVAPQQPNINIDAGNNITSGIEAKSTIDAEIVSSLVQVDTGEITNLSALFQDPKDIVDPEKLKKFYKKLEELDDTDDSDWGFIEKPVLGKIAWIRRTKNALSKANLLRRTDSIDDPLFSTVWSQGEIRDAGPGIDNESYANNDEIIQIEQDFEDVDPTTIRISENENIDTDDDTDMPTAAEVRNKMAEIHLRHCQPAQRNKSARPRKNNKISPETSGFETGSFNRRGKSAPIKQKYKSRSSPPDPLEPWSTRDLQSISSILNSK